MIAIVRSLRTPTVLVLVAMVTLAALAGGLWLRLSSAEVPVGALSPNTPINAPTASEAQQNSMERPARQTALFLGDDFAAGQDGTYVYTYPNIVCDIMDLNCNVDAQTGTGFIAEGTGPATKRYRLLDRLTADRRIYSADLIIVDAGRNDLQAGPEAMAQAVSECLADVRQRWPSAKLVLIAPAPFAAESDEAYGEFLSTITPITESLGGIVIDPIMEGWYSGVDRSTYVAEDGIHPTQGGQQLIAQKLSESLVAHGLLERPRMATR